MPRTTPALILGVLLALAVAAVQLLAFRHYIDREIAWNFVLRGDTNWYVWHVYSITEAIRAHDWPKLWHYSTSFAWGMPLFLEAAAIQLLHGPSRAGVAVLNLIYFLFAQAATFVVFRRIGGSVWSGLAALALLLAMQTPFRGDGPGLNIADFHFDLVFFYCLLGILYLAAWSDTFARRGPALVLAAFAALAVATRLVGLFLLTGVFGMLLVYLLLQWWRAVPTRRRAAGARAANLAWAAIAFVLLCAIPVGIAAQALYYHYFRFVFDPQYRATREGLYTMGANLGTEAYQLLFRMLAFDFGWPFAAALVFAVLLALLAPRRRPAVTPGPSASALAAVGRPGDSRRAVLHFLLLAIVVSYGMHLVFPIKSDHLTRMTAAPVLVLIGLLLAPAIARACAEKGGRRAIAFGLLALLVAAGVGVQARFYLSPSRFALQRADMEEVNRLYADMSRLVQARGLSAVALSTDKVSEFELGPFLGFIIREYERRGVLLQLYPRLGAFIDRPIDKASAFAQVEQSDFVLMQEKPYPESGWPFMKSIAGFHDDLAGHVAARHCLVGRYRMWGQQNALYVRPLHWRVAASASSQPIYGPQGLFGHGGTIWHGPWPPSAGSQWVSFEAPRAVQLTALVLTAQDGAPARAPRDFKIEAVDEDGSIRTVLAVSGVDFAGQQTRRFALPAGPPARRYRLVLTANNGDPSFVTIQDAQVEVAARDCSGID